MSKEHIVHWGNSTILIHFSLARPDSAGLLIGPMPSVDQTDSDACILDNIFYGIMRWQKINSPSIYRHLRIQCPPIMISAAQVQYLGKPKLQLKLGQDLMTEQGDAIVRYTSNKLTKTRQPSSLWIKTLEKLWRCASRVQSESVTNLPTL